MWGLSDQMTFQSGSINSPRLPPLSPCFPPSHSLTHTVPLFIPGRLFIQKARMEWPVDSQHYHCIVSACFCVCMYILYMSMCVCVHIWARAHISRSVCTCVSMCPRTHITDGCFKYSFSSWCLSSCPHMRARRRDNRPFVARGATVTLFGEGSVIKSFNHDDEAAPQNDCFYKDA